MTRVPASRHAGALVLLLALGAGGSCAADKELDEADRQATVELDPRVATPQRYARALGREVNIARLGLGLSSMHPSRCLTRAAGARAEEIGNGALEHRPMPDIAGRCTGAGRVAENLARGAGTPGDIVAAWLESPGHRNNLVDPTLSVLGTACTRHGGDVLCVQLYAEQS